MGSRYIYAEVLEIEWNYANPKKTPVGSKTIIQVPQTKLKILRYRHLTTADL